MRAFLTITTQASWPSGFCKVKVKVSEGFRTQEGADEFACFHSIVETARRNGKSKFKTLLELIIEETPDASFIERMIV